MSLELAYKVRTYSSGTHGRAICNARNHHFVSDDAGGEELGAGELFFSGVAACAVNMVERIAKNDNVPLDWMDVGIEAYRDNEKPQGDRTVYDEIRINIQLWGVDDDQGEYLVGLWKQRCPLYGSVVTATPNTSVIVDSQAEVHQKEVAARRS
jgi:uncharacterized OsmC-like protein